MKDNNVFDTVLVIQTESNTYFFDYESKVLVDKQYKEYEKSGSNTFWIVLIVVIFLILIIF